MFFLGTFDYAMDERGRIPIPPRYRDAFQAGAVLSQGSPDRCVRIHTREAFQAYGDALLAQSPLKQRGKDLRRGFFGLSHEVMPDPQHRLLVPPPLRAWADLSGKVLLMGVGETMELWNPEVYAEEAARIEQALPSLLESIEDRR